MFAGPVVLFVPLFSVWFVPFAASTMFMKTSGQQVQAGGSESMAYGHMVAIAVAKGVHFIGLARGLGWVAIASCRSLWKRDRGMSGRIQGAMAAIATWLG